jgi:hypothetical protein
MRLTAIPDPSTIELPIEPFVSLGSIVLGAFITGCFGLAGIWLTKRLNKLERMAEPTSNGFAKRTDNDLKTVLAAVERIEDRVDRINDRFNDHIERKN